MFGPFSLWSTTFRLPLSGDVSQEIEPRFVSPDIKGVPEIEQEVITTVASYGKQLGKILEALQTLGNQAGVDLPEIESLNVEIEAAKTRAKEAVQARAEAALEDLRKVDEQSWRKLTGEA